MSQAHLFISVSGDGTMNHVLWMTQGSYVLELVPFGFEQFDSRVLKVYHEAGSWLGLDHTQIAEATGPPCPQQGDKCRAFYRKRKMVANVTQVRPWLRKRALEDLFFLADTSPVDPGDQLGVSGKLLIEGRKHSKLCATIDKDLMFLRVCKFMRCSLPSPLLPVWSGD